jgi:hypothetical protein
VAEAAGKPGLFGLVKLGAALHVYADSFAHDGFSGRWEEGNRLARLEVLNGYPPLWESLAGVAWPVGHAQLGTIPDLGWAHWRAHMASGEVIERRNPQAFREAAAAILDLLGGRLAPGDWRRVEKLLAHRGAEGQRCAAWQEAWEIPPYDAGAWEREARAAAGDSDRFITTPWALFHRAARAQRCQVMEEFGLL